MSLDREKITKAEAVKGILALNAVLEKADFMLHDEDTGLDWTEEIASLIAKAVGLSNDLVFWAKPEEEEKP